MTRNTIINPQISYALTALGHTQSIVICDPGLPIPKEMEVIDLSLTLGQLAFMPVLEAVLTEGVFESCIYAEEVKTASADFFNAMSKALGDLDATAVSHEAFKEQAAEALVYIRTGEATPYANIILVGGVPF